MPRLIHRTFIAAALLAALPAAAWAPEIIGLDESASAGVQLALPAGSGTLAQYLWEPASVGEGEVAVLGAGEMLSTVAPESLITPEMVSPGSDPAFRSTAGTNVATHPLAEPGASPRARTVPRSPDERLACACARR